MSPRFIVVADFHANLWSKYSKPCDDVNTRFHHQRVILRQIFKLAKEKKANVVFDGDIFDSRGSIDCRVTNMVFHEIMQGTKSINPYRTYLLAGNHDQVDNSTRPANSISLFKKNNGKSCISGLLNNLTVIDYPITICVSKDYGMTFLPYSEDKKYLLNYLNKTIKDFKETDSAYGTFNDTKQVLFGHLGVAGAKMGAHLVRLSGEFSLKDLHPDFFDWIILGHYHHRQFLDDSHHALYVGNTIPLRHEDDNQEKGVGYLDISKGFYKFIPLNSPMFFTFNLENVDKKAKNISREKSALINLNKSNFVRVVSSNRAKLDWYAKHGVDTLYKPNHVYHSRLDIKPSNSSKQIVSKYIDKYNKGSKVKKVALQELEKAYDKQSK